MQSHPSGIVLGGFEELQGGSRGLAEYARRKVGGLIEVGLAMQVRPWASVRASVFTRSGGDTGGYRIEEHGSKLSFERISLATELHTHCRRQAVVEPTSPVSESLQ